MLDTLLDRSSLATLYVNSFCNFGLRAKRIAVLPDLHFVENLNPAGSLALRVWSRVGSATTVYYN